MLSGEVAKRYGHAGPAGRHHPRQLTGTAGQSFGAFLAKGVTFELEGEGNDYVGKGLSGGRIVIRPPPTAGIVPEESIIVGNTVLYGAIAGECYFRGIAGERFAVRNSGAIAVVEGTGDHGCEYMTGGVVVVLGQTGRNFAAGMSGGIAYVLDEDGTFEKRCNMAMVELEPVAAEEEISDKRLRPCRRPRDRTAASTSSADMTRYDAERLHILIARHARFTGSKRAARDPRRTGTTYLPKFRKVMPVEYRRALAELKALEAAEAAESRLACVSVNGQDHRLSRVRTRRPRLRAGRGARFSNYNEFVLPLPEKDTREQAARCMNCGVPYCHGTNTITGSRPAARSTTRSRTGTTSSIAATGKRRARNLHSTNNFPEFTGRVCPAPCEASCTLNIDDNPVTIKTIECAIVDRAIENGWVKPERYAGQDRQEGRGHRLGPGRPGLRAAARARRPRRASLREERQGRRPAALRHPRLQDGEAPSSTAASTQMEAEGVTFHYGVHVGVDLPVEKLAAGLRRGGADRRRREAARPADPRPRARRHPFRHGFPAAAEPPRQRRAARQRRADPRRAASTSS